MDRKAAIRAYKQTPRPIGVFRIVNKTNGKILIGASTDLPAMLNRQQAQLRFGMHPNAELLHDWKALGPDAFLFEIADVLSIPDREDYDPAEDLAALEALWHDRLQPYGEHGYNERPRGP